MGRSINPAVWKQWRERLRRFKSSGLTVAAYCRAEGVSTARFYQWRKTFGDRSVSNDQRKEPTSQRPAFVPVVPTSLTSIVIVTLANGIRVELPAADHALVGHVVQAVASPGGDS